MILYVANGTVVVEGRRRLPLSLYQKYDVNSKIAKTISMTMSIDEIKSVTIVMEECDAAAMLFIVLCHHPLNDKD
jgi:hypothetical protein